MKTAAIAPKISPAAVLCAVAAILLSFACARPAAAWYEDSWGYDSYGSGWGDAERMQDQSIAHAEESAREAGRVVRRAEIAEEQKQKSAETAAYYASVMDASKASLNAPRGVYYRKPGYISSDTPPPGSPSVTAGPVTLIYDQGVYWYPRGADYQVVIPPPGVVVDKIPAGIRVIPTKGGGTLLYYFGVFYTKKGDKYEVVKPPAGTLVGYLPDGYTQESEKDATVFVFGGTRYKQVYLQGVLVYQVV